MQALRSRIGRSSSRSRFGFMVDVLGFAGWVLGEMVEGFEPEEGEGGRE